MRLEELNALDADSAARELQRCCGSTRWAEAMAAARPFTSADAVAAVSDRIWASLERRDWLQALAAHPRIGEIPRSPWEASEQAGVVGEGMTAGNRAAALRERDPVSGTSPLGGGDYDPRVESAARVTLARLNRDYEARFGYLFIVCATGKSAAEIVALLEDRLGNNPDEELLVAVEEQRRITRLRLSRLLR
jgi:2-oxo-4-hydroxy-4-carboxy-5-ureidoimidazoline decarboxylase